MGDRRLGTHPLTRAEGMAEGQLERRAKGALLLGHALGLAHLALHLHLAEHGRIQPGRNREQMLDRLLIPKDGQVGQKTVRGDIGQVDQQVAEVLERTVETLGFDVDLGAVAGGEDHSLGHVVARGQGRQQLRGVVCGHGKPLKHLQGEVAVCDSDEQH